ncbi:MAG: hypothetical protein LBV15_04365 [Planctomycetota bacterium]|jgi:hypothetical protein|nr:hypothetical protein [Planctomycetota bacterium]
MAQLNVTLADLAPRVSQCRDLPGRYNPRHCLAIYFLTLPGYSLAAPGVILGEAMSARNGLGCTLLEGLPLKIPEGATIIGHHEAIKAERPELLDGLPELGEKEYLVKLDGHALVVSRSSEGLANGAQTLAMLTLRHQEDTLPGSLIIDGPVCHSRGISVELVSREIGVNLLLQIASFAATFKANRLHLSLDADFNPGMDIPGLSGFLQTCQSHCIKVGVRLPWLGDLLAGRRQLRDAWAGIRAAARLFGASQAVLDDPCPPNADPKQARLVMDSILRGEVGVPAVSLDALAIIKAGCSPYQLKSVSVTGWHRLPDSGPPPPELGDLPVRIEVRAPLPGFSGLSPAAFHRDLDSAMSWLGGRQRRRLMVCFRDLGVSHLWQNLLYPAATGLISAWGNPREADQAAWLFSNLLYGSSASRIMEMWEQASAAFPKGLSSDDERRLRRVAFGSWPEDEGTLAALAGIDWGAVTRNVAAAADSLQEAAGSLARNAATLSGAKVALQALSWLHCFSSLAPELERRRQSGFNEDGRTEIIASELLGSFAVWYNSLRRLQADSGLELAEMPALDRMRQRIVAMCRSREMFE